MILRATALVLFFLAATAPARAWSPAQTAQLATGNPVVVLAPGSDSDAIHIRAAIEIPASAKTVWSILTDCARASHFVPGLESCRVLKRDPAGRWDIREHKIAWMWFLPRIHSVFRADYDPPKRLRFHRIAGTLKRNQGEWRLTALPRGGTRVSYDATMAASIPVPNFMIENALKRDIATVLRRLKRECQSAARR
jgi:ribosome-associated toxin RatA of RatAB toxin-antitoxin module